MRCRRAYLRGDQILELLARIVGGTAAWLLEDRMGSVRNVVDNTGAVIDTIGYDGYGNVVSETIPANGGQYKYDGYRYDVEVGLYYVGFRFYDPVTGHWLTRDPSVFGGRNLYPYVDNQPTNCTDPSGLIKLVGKPRIRTSGPLSDLDEEVVGNNAYQELGEVMRAGMLALRPKIKANGIEVPEFLSGRPRICI